MSAAPQDIKSEWRDRVRALEKVKADKASTFAGLTKARKDSAAEARVRQEIAALLARQEEARAAEYLIGESAVSELPKIADAIRTAEVKLDSLKKGASSAIIVLERRLAAAVKEEEAAEGAVLAAQHRWAGERHPSVLKALNAWFDGLEALLADLAAVEDLMPEPNFYPMLGIHERTAGEKIFDAVTALKSSNGPSLPTVPKWMRQAKNLRQLPSFPAARERLAKEVTEILEGDGQ